MKYSNLKGSMGFLVSWLILIMFSGIMIWVDWKITVLGAIVSTIFGFLGFDMVGDIIKSKNRKRGKVNK